MGYVGLGSFRIKKISFPAQIAISCQEMTKNKHWKAGNGFSTYNFLDNIIIFDNEPPQLWGNLVWELLE